MKSFALFVCGDGCLKLAHRTVTQKQAVFIPHEFYDKSNCVIDMPKMIQMCMYAHQTYCSHRWQASLYSFCQSDYQYLNKPESCCNADMRTGTVSAVLSV